MFVSDNSIKALKKYFLSSLTDCFSEREIKTITKHVIVQRFNFDETQYLLSNELRLSESDLLYFRSIVKRLQKNEPLQYVLGNALFYGINLNIDSRALIPRPETEELVQWVEETLEPGSHNILDICSGSGCIALALKSVFNDSYVLGVDVSDVALNLANENAITNNLKVDFQYCDVLNESMARFANFNVWISNPPYIPVKDKPQMNANVLNFEPHIALFVEDEDAILFYKKIGENAITYLPSEGFLFFEIHEEYHEAVLKLLEIQGFVNIQLRKDLQGKPRMVKAQKPKFTS